MGYSPGSKRGGRQVAVSHKQKLQFRESVRYSAPLRSSISRTRRASFAREMGFSSKSTPSSKRPWWTTALRE